MRETQLGDMTGREGEKGETGRQNEEKKGGLETGREEKEGVRQRDMMGFFYFIFLSFFLSLSPLLPSVALCLYKIMVTLQR